MIFPRKRFQQNLQQQKKKQGSTINSDKVSSIESKSKRKSFLSTYKNNKNNADKYKINAFTNKDNQKSTYSNQEIANNSEYGICKKIKQKNCNVQQRDLEKQKIISGLEKQKSLALQSSQSQQQIELNENNLNKNKKKFKLYCELKKKRKVKNQKRMSEQNQFQKEKNKCCNNNENIEEIKLEIIHESNTKQKQFQKERKIFFNHEVKIKNKQRQHNSNFLTVKHSLRDSKYSSQSSHGSRNSSDKKESTVKVKKSLIRTNYLTPKISQFYDDSFRSNNSNEQKINEFGNNQTPRILINQNPILVNFIQQPKSNQKNLSLIVEEKNQQTVLHTVRVYQNSMDQTSFQFLGINSICKIIPHPNHKMDNISSQNNFLSNNSYAKQSVQKRSLESSSMSEMQKSRQKIKIQKIMNQKQKNIIKFGEMGSQISEIQQNLSIIEKIQLHIQILNCMSDFVSKSTQIDYLMQDWDELNFLIYKKFYIERMKVLNFIKKYPIKNPFCLKRATIETKDLIKQISNNALQILRIREYLQVQNQTIKKNLQLFFNNFTQSRHGERINLFQYDNFNSFIFKQLWDEIQLFSYSRSHSQEELEDRIFRSLQIGFLISEVNGRYVVPFQNAEIASFQGNKKQFIDDNLKVFQRYVLHKNR